MTKECKMRIFKTAVTCFAIILLIWGCNRSENIKLPDHSVFFPIEENRIQKFYIKSITIDRPMNYYDTLEYYISIEPDSIYINSNMLIGEYTVFRGNSIATTTMPDNRLIRELAAPAGMYVENIDNCRKVKCRLPVIAGNYWNPGIYCSESDTVPNSVIKNIKTLFTLNDKLFDSVVHIVNHYDSSLINLNIEQEFWAAHHGLIYKEITNISSNDAGDLDPTIPIRERIRIGTIVEIFQVFE